MSRPVAININGRIYERTIDPRMLLSDFIRDEAALTGTHVGCEHGVCGACTIQLDGAPCRSCTIFAVEAAGQMVRTVEALSQDGCLSTLQQAFIDAHALQCGFCTPGMLMTLDSLVRSHGTLKDAEIREAIAGNLCRCTGYQQIVEAVQLALISSSEVSR